MNKSKLKKITSARLFLPIVCLIAVLLLNVIRTPAVSYTHLTLPTTSRV